jgi:predicted ATPase
MVSPVLIGRHAELDLLEQALHTAQNGDGRLVLLSGEAGIGKSRLVEEARRAAEENLTEDAIKRAVKQWRADTYRA